MTIRIDTCQVAATGLWRVTISLGDDFITVGDYPIAVARDQAVKIAAAIPDAVLNHITEESW